ncbi:isoprenyl transferase [Lactovum miscens]|uniref:Isoprenyl transferase n=1 Tax=Lactovum miscens TaxID=190387 RepID=A0A841C7A3_9LACT|nr:isoprenyl transferase [Lactovum miscens]MBB5888673.1 undecaprenyl diphosphate synthase [Lactovum miscens]
MTKEVKIPAHIGIIMDGNGRWAKKKGKPRIFGHKAGMDAIERTAIYAQKLGVKLLTVYAFSTENWSRPMDEVKFIMSLPIDFYSQFVPVLNRENIQISMIGERDSVPKATLKAIDKASEDTANNTGMILNFAMNYGGRAEIIKAVKNIITSRVNPDDVNEALIAENLSTAIFPTELRDPELIIRTSGELRLSNFLTWQSAYSELLFTDTLWPDFDEAELDKAITEYSGRDRRFGGLKS